MAMLCALLLLLQAADKDDKSADKAATEAVDRFQKAFKGIDAEKIAAVQELGKTEHNKTANRLGGVLTGGESQSVRIAAALALGGFQEQKKGASTVLSNALPSFSKELVLFQRTAYALAGLHEPGGVAALSKYFEDKDEHVAVASITAAGMLGSTVAMDQLLPVLGRCERIMTAGSRAAGLRFTDPGSGDSFVAPPELRPYYRARALATAIQKALVAITKEEITGSESWQAWWSKNRASLERK